jgi:hypothetical protein
MARLGWLRKVAGPVNTTDGTTVTTIHTVDLTALPELVKADGTFVAFNGAGLHVEGVLVGRDTNNGDVVTVRASRAFNRISGNLSGLGNAAVNIVAPQGSAALTTAAVTIDASSNSIRLRVTGVAGKTIEWTGFLELFSGEFSG